MQADTQETLNKVRIKTIEQKLRAQQFQKTLDIVQDLNNNKPDAFPLLYAFRVEEMDSEIKLIKEQATWYKSGKNDPARIVGLERMQKKKQKKQKTCLLWAKFHKN